MNAIIWALIIGLGTTITYFGQKDNIIKMEAQESKKGQAFGRGKTGSECFNHVINKGKKDQSLQFRMRQKIFLHHCFKTASKSEELCQQFQNTVLQTLWESQRLALKICDQWGLSFVMGCNLFAEEVQLYCKSPKKS